MMLHCRFDYLIMPAGNYSNGLGVTNLFVGGRHSGDEVVGGGGINLVGPMEKAGRGSHRPANPGIAPGYGHGYQMKTHQFPEIYSSKSR
jgi:hypothetical protein